MAAVEAMEDLTGNPRQQGFACAETTETRARELVTLVRARPQHGVGCIRAAVEEPEQTRGELQAWGPH